MTIALSFDRKLTQEFRKPAKFALPSGWGDATHRQSPRSSDTNLSPRHTYGSRDRLVGSDQIRGITIQG